MLILTRKPGQAVKNQAGRISGPPYSGFGILCRRPHRGGGDAGQRISGQTRHPRPSRLPDPSGRALWWRSLRESAGEGGCLTVQSVKKIWPVGVGDLDKATDIACNMVTRFGMSEKPGQLTYEEQRQGFLGQAQGLTARNYSEETAREIDCAVRDLTDRARDRAMRILSTYRTQLDKGTKLLLEKEILVAADLPQLEQKTTRDEQEAVTS